MNEYTVHPDLFELYLNTNDFGIFLNILAKFGSNEHPYILILDNEGQLIDKYSISISTNDILREWFEHIMKNRYFIRFLSRCPNLSNVNELIIYLAENNHSKKAIVADFQNKDEILSKSNTITILDTRQAEIDLRLPHVLIGSNSVVAMNHSQIAQGAMISQNNNP